MSTIPASALVNVIPSVIEAGGTGLVLNGVMLTTSWRVPTGGVSIFPSALAVGEYFGLTSPEYNQAVIYFNGYLGCIQLPGSLIVAQYTGGEISAWLKSGPVDTMTLAQIQGITGSLTVTMDNYPRVVSSIDLSGATSYTAAGALLQAALNAADPSDVAFSGSIAPGSATFIGGIQDDILTVNSMTSGTSIFPGALLAGYLVAPHTLVSAQISGTTGGVGEYTLSVGNQNVADGTVFTSFHGVLTVQAVTTGTLSIGQTLSTNGFYSILAGTTITALGTGTGLGGTYIVQNSQTVTLENMSGGAYPLVVSYDSTWGSFVITSGIAGSMSMASFATGTAAARLMLTAQTGALVSQGVDALMPGPFMTQLTRITQNWASFWTLADPDVGIGNARKLAFCAWVSAQNSRYVYLCTDSDMTATDMWPATTSLGYLCSSNANNYAGVHLIYDPNNEGLAPFIAGSIASINFGATNGRITFAFREQNGLTATVTDPEVASNLLLNGYNFYGAYATANETFLLYQNGSITGQFQWLDSYVNQIWMNAQFQLDLILLLKTVGNIPYNASGYAMIPAACGTTINQALNFGAIRAGVPLSSLQALDVNQQAGYRIDDVLAAQGFYFQVQATAPQVRQTRQSPPCFFWYTDGQSIQQITLNSIELM